MKKYIVQKNKMLNIKLTKKLIKIDIIEANKKKKNYSKNYNNFNKFIKKMKNKFKRIIKKK